MPTQDAPNLYVAQPGSGPRFVATLESSLNGPQPPARGRIPDGALAPFGVASGLAVDHQNGNVYVLDTTCNTVQRFDSHGNPAGFSLTAPYVEGNKLTGSESAAFSQASFLPAPTQLAVHNDPSSPSFRDLYVPDFFHNVVDKFSPSGEFLGSLSVTLPSGVAVDQATGHVYVTSLLRHSHDLRRRRHPDRAGLRGPSVRRPCRSPLTRPGRSTSRPKAKRSPTTPRVLKSAPSTRAG